VTAIAGWQNFYVIIGSSAGALIGLQFVVLSLISNRSSSGRGDADAGAAAAFATPTIIHFATALVLSAILSAPWKEVEPATVLCGLLGIGGLVYTILVIRRMRRQTAYRPQFEDWLFHVLLPFASYITLTISAFVARSHVYEALFGVGASALLLLLIGIHNAWDGVTYHVFVRRH